MSKLPKVIRSKRGIKLPSSRKHILYQTFSFGNLKALLETIETNDIVAILSVVRDIIINCTNMSKKTVDVLPLEDFLFTFTLIYIHSAGDKVRLALNCDCGGQGVVDVDIGDIEFNTQNPEPIVVGTDEKGNDIIVEMNVVTYDVISKVKPDDLGAMYKLIIKSVKIGEEEVDLSDVSPDELVDFVFSFDASAIAKIDGQLFDESRLFSLPLKTKCQKCGETVSMEVASLADFFELSLPVTH
jgi:hypothetical protein